MLLFNGLKGVFFSDHHGCILIRGGFFLDVACSFEALKSISGVSYPFFCFDGVA